MKQYTKFLFLVLLLGVAVLPESAFAADNIFQVISKKMISTVIDVRRIVYVIAGFGLIMFTTLAIFNKISFKHLAYIMIGLSLLAVMMPFINYFSGANLQDSEYSYGNFINGGSNASITGSDIGGDIGSGDGKNCSGADCPNGNPDADPDNAIKQEAGKQGDGSQGKNNNGGGDNQQSVTTDWDSNGCRTNNGKQECCSGKIQDGACRKSAAQVISDILKLANAGVTAGNQAINTVEYAKKVKSAIDDGTLNVADIIAGDKNTLEKLGALANSVSDTAHKIRTGSSQANSNAQGFLENLGTVLDGISGNNSSSTKIEESGVGATIDNAASTVNDGANKAIDAAKTGSDAYKTGKNAEALGNRVDGFFGNK